MTRMSVAVHLPPGVADVLRALDCPELPGVAWSEPEQWIVKLRPLGHVAPDVARRVAERLDVELDGAPVVSCELGPATRRLAGRWLGVPVHGLDELSAVVFEVTEDLVPVTHPQPFSADVVLARGSVPKELAGVPVHAAWTATEIALVADRSSPHGPRLEDVATVPLGR